jgi:hypothetical protein
MQQIRYRYQDELLHSYASPIYAEGKRRFMVAYNDTAITLVPSAFRTKDGRIIWVQFNKPGEVIYPHDLIPKHGRRVGRSGHDRLAQQLLLFAVPVLPASFRIFQLALGNQPFQYLRYG